ncbi:tripartite motif-containing protein 16-like [Centropristis striata]|uniref:tripartite motif-containing protein 16-like n=1 Tax=Centropristis striata TaxID=184440 RepID=UPI0027E1B5C8|nr:tripartite motif-containing protein 16-like [Centropristis striata]
MAQRGLQLDRQKFCCLLCLDLLTDPVTTSCGHSYCSRCIQRHWDSQDVHSCPRCRQTFTPRPVLGTNSLLADLVEELKRTGLGAPGPGPPPPGPPPPPPRCYAGPGDVSCDVCVGTKLKAERSCLQCLASYCEQHLQPHYDVAPLKKHKLVEPSEKLQENICPRHHEVMKMFCRTDRQSICYLCSVDQHKGHDTVSAAAERSERQKELEVSRLNIQQRIQDREKDVKLLQQELEAINLSADKAVEDSEKMFTELIRLMQKRSSEVKRQVRSQQETEVSGVKEVEEKLQQEIRELKRKDAELKKLSNTEFLHSYSSLSALSPSPPRIPTRRRDHDHMTAAVSRLRDKLQDVLRDKWTDVSLPKVDLSPPPPAAAAAEPETRAEFLLRFFHQIHLDPNTLRKQLVLSKNNRKLTCDAFRSYAAHPDRFASFPQVLSQDALPGRCYWEVEWSGLNVSVAVSYRSIARTGPESHFGDNDKSWSLRCHRDGYEFRHRAISTVLVGPKSSLVGVFLDHHTGRLSFYNIGKTTTLLHRVQTAFSQPLHAGLEVYLGSAKILKHKSLEHKSLPKTIRDHQRPPETIRDHQRPSETIGDHQRPSETIGDHLRPSETIRDHQRPPETIRDHLRRPETTGDHQRPSETTRDLQRPSETIRDHQRPPETIGDHQRPPETFRDHQKPSETRGVQR